MDINNYQEVPDHKTAREVHLEQTLKQIDQQFGKKELTPVQKAKIDEMLAEKAAKKAQGPIQKGKDWAKTLKKQPVRSAAWDNVTAKQHHTLGSTITMPYNSGYKGVYDPTDYTDFATAIPMTDVLEILKRTATSANITAAAQGQNMKVEVTFEGNALQRFANMCAKGRPGGNGNTQYDLEILQEQVTEVGDDFSADFKKGIEAAVAVLLQGAHLEEFLS